MSRKRIAFTIAGSLAGLIVLAGVAAIFVLRSAWFYEKVRARIVRTVETATGGRVEAGSFQFDWTRLRAEIRMFVIHGTEPADKPPLFRAGSVAVGLKITSVLKRHADIQYLEVVGPHVCLIVGPDGRTNVPEPKVKPSGNTADTILNLAIGRFNVRDGVFEVESRGKIPFDARGRNLNAKFLYERAGPRYRGDLSIQPLELEWSGYMPVPLSVAMAVTIEKNRIGLTSVKLTTGASVIDLSGAVEDLASPRASCRYDARISLGELARILRVTELRRGTAQVGGIATWTGSSNYSATGSLHAYGVGYRDSFVSLQGFSVDGALTAGPKGIDLGGARLLGSYVVGDNRVPVDARIADVALRGRELDFHGLELAALGGGFSGEVRLRDLDRYTVTGDFSGMEARRVVAVYISESLFWDGLVSGPLSLEGSLSDSSQLRVTAGLTIVPGGRSGGPLRGQIAASYDASSGILDLGRSTVALPSSRADFSGAIGREMRVHLETRDLSDILPALGESAAKLPVKLENGVLVFDGAVSGRLDNPRIAGRLSVTRFSYSGQAFDGLEADVSASPANLGLRNAALARGSLRAQFELAVGLHEWQTGDGNPIFGNATIRNAGVADLAALAGAESLAATGTLDGSAQLTGTIGNPLLQADIDVTRGAFREEPFDRLTAHVSYSGRGVEITSGQLTAGAKQVRLNAALDAGHLRFQVTSNVMPLEQIRTLQNALPGVKGTVQVTANGEAGMAPFRISDLHADVSLHGLEWTGQPLGDAHLTANSQGQVLRAHVDSDFAGSAIQGDGQWRLEGDYPGSATVTFSRLDFARLRDWAATSGVPFGPGGPSPFAGSAEGELRIDGPALQPQAMKAELRVSKLEIGPAPGADLAGQSGSLALHNSGPIVARMANSVITLENARLVGRAGDLNISGKVLTQRENPLDLRVNGRIDLSVIQGFSRDISASGVAAADVTVRGSLAAPQINGRMELQNAALNIADFPNAISKANGVVLFTRERATIQSLAGETGGGKIELSGFADYHGGPIMFRLHARAEEVRVRYPEGVSTVADASLSLTGTLERSMLAGDVTIRRAGFNPQSDLSSLLGRSAQPVQTPAVRTGLLGGMNFDVQIATAPDIQFQSTLTQDFQAEASLRLRGNVSNPALLGRVNITQGQVMFFGTKYAISQGSVAFYNPAKVEPVVNVDLETKARGIDVTLTVSGVLGKLNLTPRSDPPLQFSEIVALLATGRTPTSDPTLLAQQRTSPQSWQQQSPSALLGQAIANPVAGRLQRFFGVSQLRIDPMLPGVESNPQARLTLEQQVTPEITFTYITNVTSSNPQVVRVEWSLSKQWSVVALREENGLLGLDFFYKRRFK